MVSLLRVTKAPGEVTADGRRVDGQWCGHTRQSQRCARMHAPYVPLGAACIMQTAHAVTAWPGARGGDAGGSEDRSEGHLQLL